MKATQVLLNRRYDFDSGSDVFFVVIVGGVLDNFECVFYFDSSEDEAWQQANATKCAQEVARELDVPFQNRLEA